MIKVIFPLLLFGCLLFSCNKEENPPPSAPTKVTITSIDVMSFQANVGVGVPWDTDGSAPDLQINIYDLGVLVQSTTVVQNAANGVMHSFPINLELSISDLGARIIRLIDEDPIADDYTLMSDVTFHPPSVIDYPEAYDLVNPDGTCILRLHLVWE